VQRIAERSPTAGELAIKRQAGDNHREELYVSKADLREKLEPLPAALRGAFDPLGLWTSTAPAAEPFALLRTPGTALPLTVPSPVAASTSHPPDGDGPADATREQVALYDGTA
jgi:hypothetical protein